MISNSGARVSHHLNERAAFSAGEHPDALPQLFDMRAPDLHPRRQRRIGLASWRKTERRNGDGFLQTGTQFRDVHCLDCAASSERRVSPLRGLKAGDCAQRI